MPDVDTFLTKNRGPSRTFKTMRARLPSNSYTGSSISATQVSLFPIVAFEQFGDLHRIGEQLLLEILLVDDVVEHLRIDTARSLEREANGRETRAGLDAEDDAALIRPDLLYVALDLRPQIVVGHQPREQRLVAVVDALGIEDAAVPLCLDVFDHAVPAAWRRQTAVRRAGRSSPAE